MAAGTGRFCIARLFTGPELLLRPVVDRYPVTFSGTSEEAVFAAAVRWLRKKHRVEPVDASRQRVPIDPKVIDALVETGRGWRYEECPWCGVRQAAANHRDDPPTTIWTCPDCNRFSLTDEARDRLEEWREQDRGSWVLVRQRMRRLMPLAAIDAAISVESLNQVRKPIS
jgi:hypothetical protein